MKRIFAAVVVITVLAGVPVCAQQFPALGDDNTSSLGSFKLQVTNQFAGMFAGCPGWNNPDPYQSNHVRSGHQSGPQ